MEPWRPAKDEWCRISFDGLDGSQEPPGGLFGLIMRASRRDDTFFDGSGRKHHLKHIKPGSVWKVLTTDGKVHHWHQSHLRPLKKKCTKGSESS